jgi:four helix bundle protein
MSGSQFRDLRVHRLARAHANRIHDVVVLWPKFELWTVGIQLVRAADSVTANIAEAMGRQHLADRRRLLVIARGSLLETENWLVLAEDRQLMPKGTANQVEDVAKALNGLIRRPG